MTKMLQFQHQNNQMKWTWIYVCVIGQRYWLLEFENLLSIWFLSPRLTFTRRQLNHWSESERKWPLLHKMIKTQLTTNCILNKPQINISQVQQSSDLYPAPSTFSGLIWLQGQKELLYKLSVGKPTMQMQSQMSNSTLNDNSYHSDRIPIFPPRK